MFKKFVLNQYMKIVQNSISEADLYVTGDIVDMKWWDEDVTPQDVLDKLNDIEGIQTLNLVINSNGGSVHAGNFIVDILDEYRRKSNVKIQAKIANAYSMASGIAMVADTVSIYSNGVFMIHKPLSSTWGNADDLRKTAEVLDVYESTLIKNYMRHFNGTEDELRELLEAETWMGAEEALEFGFVDEIIEPLEMVASFNGIIVNGVSFNDEKVVNILKTKINESEGDVEMKYDQILLDMYGISEEAFNAFDNVADLMQIINAKVNADLETAKEEAVKECEAKYENALVIEFEEVKNVFEVEDSEEAEEAILMENFTAENILNWAKQAKELDPEIQNKIGDYEEVVKERDLMRKETVDSAIEMGIRAMGAENFNKTSWEKALSNMDYVTVCNMKKDWENVAKKSLNAGGTVSQQSKQHQNPNNGVSKASGVPKKENLNV